MTPKKHSRCDILRWEARARKRLSGMLFHETENVLRFNLDIWNPGVIEVIEVTRTLKVSEDGFKMEYIAYIPDEIDENATVSMAAASEASEKLLASINVSKNIHDAATGKIPPNTPIIFPLTHDVFERYRWLLDELKTQIPEAEFDWIAPNYGWDFSISGELKDKRIGVKIQVEGVSIFDGKEKDVVLQEVIARFREKLL